MLPHAIRLRGPWKLLLPQQPPQRVAMPAALDATGEAVFLRAFGYPGEIDDHERIWLHAEGLIRPADLSLNGTALPRGETRDTGHDVTRLMRPRNELRLSTTLLAGVAPWREVFLEVRATAWVEGVFVERHYPSCTVRGLVMGAADRPLELYVVAEPNVREYREVVPTAGGTAFAVTMPIAPETVKVELVRGSVVWYTREYAAQPATGPEGDDGDS